MQLWHDGPADSTAAGVSQPLGALAHTCTNGVIRPVGLGFTAHQAASPATYGLVWVQLQHIPPTALLSEPASSIAPSLCLLRCAAVAGARGVRGHAQGPLRVSDDSTSTESSTVPQPAGIAQPVMGGSAGLFAHATGCQCKASASDREEGRLLMEDAKTSLIYIQTVKFQLIWGCGQVVSCD